MASKEFKTRYLLYVDVDMYINDYKAVESNLTFYKNKTWRSHANIIPTNKFWNRFISSLKKLTRSCYSCKLDSNKAETMVPWGP